MSVTPNHSIGDLVAIWREAAGLVIDFEVPPLVIRGSYYNGIADLLERGLISIDVRRLSGNTGAEYLSSGDSRVC